MDDAALVEAIEWLQEHIVSLDVAADCEARIQAAYLPEMAEWENLRTTKDARPDALTRMVRNSLDARANEWRLRKEVAHLRTILAAFTPPLPTERTA